MHVLEIAATPAVIKVVVRVHKLWLSKKLNTNSQNFEFFSRWSRNSPCQCTYSDISVGERRWVGIISGVKRHWVVRILSDTDLLSVEDSS
jgi:hypothetical protein